MRTEIRDQIRSHYRSVDSVQDSVEWAEIASRLEVGPSPMVVPRRSNRRGLWVAAAAVVVTILLIGVIPLLLNSDDPPVADTVVPTTLADPTPLDAFTSANPAVVAYVSSVSETAAFVGVLEVTGDEDIVLFQLGIGPEPQFDTSELGFEVVLEPWDADDDVQSKWGDWSRSFLTGGETPSEGDGQEVLNGPIFYVGEVAGFAQDLIVYDTEGEFCGGQCWGIEEFGYKSGTGDGEVLTVVVFVPLETSVVGVTTANGDRMWQRPVGGWAMFHILGTEQSRPTFDAYDAFGNEILIAEES